VAAFESRLQRLEECVRAPGTRTHAEEVEQAEGIVQACFDVRAAADQMEANGASRRWPPGSSTASRKTRKPSSHAGSGSSGSSRGMMPLHGTLGWRGWKLAARSDVGARMPHADPQELHAAVALAEHFEAAALHFERRLEGASEIVLAQLEAIMRASYYAYCDWRDAAKDAAAEDPAEWGPRCDRVRSLVSELRGNGPWVPGENGAPAGATLH
jgi:hypothetical protein